MRWTCMTPASPESALVLIGGVATDESLWDDQVGALAGIADCHPVLAHGTTIAAMADHVLAQVPAGPLALVGHSMGGYVALAIQRRHPERATRLALINSASNTEGEAQRHARQALLTTVHERGFEAMLDRLIPAMVAPDTLRDEAMMKRLGAMVRRAGGERFVREQTAVMNRPEAQSALGSIGVPTLVVVGDRDRIVPPDLGAETAARIPGATLRRLARCGHIAPVERADAIADLLAAWLTGRPLPPQEALP